MNSVLNENGKLKKTVWALRGVQIIEKIFFYIKRCLVENLFVLGRSHIIFLELFNNC